MGETKKDSRTMKKIEMRRIGIRNQRGSSMVEVSCIAALTVIVALASIGLLGDSTADAFNESASKIDEAANIGDVHTVPLGGKGKPRGQKPRRGAHTSLKIPEWFK
jgi:Flp pilus assembly pilin Flp